MENIILRKEKMSAGTNRSRFLRATKLLSEDIQMEFISIDAERLKGKLKYYFMKKSISSAVDPVVDVFIDIFTNDNKVCIPKKKIQEFITKILNSENTDEEILLMLFLFDNRDYNLLSTVQSMTQSNPSLLRRMNRIIEKYQAEIREAEGDIIIADKNISPIMFPTIKTKENEIIYLIVSNDGLKCSLEWYIKEKISEPIASELISNINMLIDILSENNEVAIPQPELYKITCTMLAYHARGINDTSEEICSILATLGNAAFDFDTIRQNPELLNSMQSILELYQSKIRAAEGADMNIGEKNKEK